MITLFYSHELNNNMDQLAKKRIKNYNNQIFALLGAYDKQFI